MPRRVPRVVIVDDAHVHLDLLGELQRLRTEECTFQIVATTWDAERDSVAEALGLRGSDVRLLHALRRRELVEVVRALGIRGPSALIGEIVTQADGKPGLAVTLSQLCLQGDVQSVVLGDHIARAATVTFKRLVGDEAVTLLSAFSLGGEGGMSMQAVGQLLGVDVVTVQTVATKLAAGGVINVVDRHRGHLVVKPATLRHALVRDAYFSGLPALPIEHLIDVAPSRHGVAETLIGAALRGARVPDEMIRPHLEALGSADLWTGYATIGPMQAEWVMCNCPDLIVDIAWPALRNRASQAIPLLLAAAVGDDRELHSAPGHPLRLIEDWVEEISAAPKDQIDRRRTLLASVAVWSSSPGGDPDVVMRAAAIALSPKLHGSTLDPGAGDTLTLSASLLNAGQLKEVADMWPDALRLLGHTQAKSWRHLFNVVCDWAFPNTHLFEKSQVPGDVASATRHQAERMLRDLATARNDHPGVLRRTQAIAGRLKVELDVSIDPLFAALYPHVDLSDYENEEKRHRAEVRALAKELSKKPPASLVSRLLWFDSKARESEDNPWPRYTPELCQALAEIVADANAWVVAALGAGASGDLAYPFLRKAALVQQPGWEQLAATCLDRPGLARSTLAILLCSPDVPARLLDRALEMLEKEPDLAVQVCLEDEVSEATKRRLLTHSNSHVAISAARGVWLANPRGAVPDNLLVDWRIAALRFREDEHRDPMDSHYVGEMMITDQQLAFDWLAVRLQGEPSRRLFSEGFVEKVLRTLDKPTRLLLLDYVQADFGWHHLVTALIGGDVDVYQGLLRRRHLQVLHLVPLQSIACPGWREMALVGVRGGIAPHDIAEAVLGATACFSWDPAPDVWAQLAERFASLLNDPDEGIRQVARAGEALAKDRQSRAAAAVQARVL